MIKIYNGKDTDIREVLLRRRGDAPDVTAQVSEIIAVVRCKGDAALFDYARQFDKAQLTNLQVSPVEIDAACKSCGDDFMQLLTEAAANIRAFHQKQKRIGFVVNDRQGVVLGQKIIPIAKAGIYVPGGTAAYPSSVLMNALPAQIAGVEQIIMATPPLPDGSVDPAILAAAKVAGVAAVFKVGGAQAIAALAYGTESIPQVDKIVGPGNIYVATAKRLVYGVVGIDMFAGPSEIMIIADETANVRYLAADLLSQAEHDKLASSILLCLSQAQAEAVAVEVERQLATLPRQEIARASIDNYGKIIVLADLEQCLEYANLFAPEHLELAVSQPFALLGGVKNAGSIFLGQYAPEALGDYFAGPNHTLPTDGTCRFSSPLSVDDFIKKSSFIYYDQQALSLEQERIRSFAEREKLQAHANSVAVRFENK